jgi:hypothetical protein
MDEHFGSKVKGLVGKMQIWAPFVSRLGVILQILNKMWLTMKE